MRTAHKNKGFTLLEILLVIAVIGILAAIVLVSINPNRQLAQARNLVRQADINTIHKALDQYLIEKGRYPTGIDNTYKEICNTGSNSINQGTVGINCIDLREIVPDYLASIPVNPTGSTQSGYYVWINDVNNKVAVLAGKGENGKVIGINHLKENIVTDGLVLHLDADNNSSLNIPSQSDHGYSDWYCLVSGTATYSITNSTGGVIYEKNGSTVTAVITASGPQRGTFPITAGRLYYGSTPINLVVEDQHQSIVPLTMMGSQFWNVAVRNNPSTYYVYSPYQSATVNFYDNTANGTTSTPTSTLSLAAGQSGTFTTNNLTNHWISSNSPILATVTQSGADKTILSPTSKYVYQRYQNYIMTTNNTSPTNNNAYVTYDNTYNVMNTTIADGSGGDSAQGLGLDYLSDSYSWGNVLSDYTIVFPYTATVTTSYWNGSAWVMWDTHSNIAASITNPGRVSRDGTQGPGVEAGNVAGFAENMASGVTLWKWEGTAPFYLNINDSADDEFSVLGWNSSTKSNPKSGNVINDISGNGNNGTLMNGVVYHTGNGGSLLFDGIDDYVETQSLNTNVNSKTLSAWVKLNSITQQGGGLVGIMSGDGGVFDTIVYNETNNGWGFGSNNFLRTSWSGVKETSTDSWVHICATYSNNDYRLYRNGVQILQTNSFSTLNFNSSSKIILGKRHSTTLGPLNSNISSSLIYNRALTPEEVQQNFNAIRGRYGL